MALSAVAEEGVSPAGGAFAGVGLRSRTGESIDSIAQMALDGDNDSRCGVSCRLKQHVRLAGHRQACGLAVLRSFGPPGEVLVEGDLMTDASVLPHRVA